MNGREQRGLLNSNKQTGSETAGMMEDVLQKLGRDIGDCRG